MSEKPTTIQEHPVTQGDSIKSIAASAVRNSMLKPGNHEEFETAERTIDGMYQRHVEEANVSKGANYLDEETAEAVAYAVKADGDAAADLQKRIDNPLARGAARTTNGSFIGAENVRDLEMQRKAAKLDFERNAEEATRATRVLKQLTGRSIQEKE